MIDAAKIGDAAGGVDDLVSQGVKQPGALVDAAEAHFQLTALRSRKKASQIAGQGQRRAQHITRRLDQHARQVAIFAQHELGDVGAG